MNYLFVLLFVTVLLYLLNRFVPGALSLLGYRGWYSTEHIDPVCGMKVKANHGYGMMYKGRLYRFCTKLCLDKFDSNQQQYLTVKKDIQEENSSKPEDM
jgi:YHS domain-containing protein